MASVTVRPNATVSLGTTVVTGAASAHAALDDTPADDASYVDLDTGGLWLQFAAPSIPAGAILRGVRQRLRADRGLSPYETVQMVSFPATPGVGVAGDQSPGYTAISWLGPTTFTVTEWGPDDFDVTDPELLMAEHGSEVTSAPRLYEAYLDFVYVPVPEVDSVTVTPSANLPGQIQFEADIDTDGGYVYQYEIKIGDTSFDPEEDEPIMQVGETVTSRVRPVPLPNGNYRYTYTGFTEVLDEGTFRAHVRVSQRVEDEILWSDWTYDEFTIDVDSPAPPTMTLTGENDDGRIRIDLLAGGNLVANPSFEPDGDLTGWSDQAGATIAATTVHAQHGDWAVRAEAPGSSAQEGVQTIPSISVTASETYRAQAWVVAEEGESIRLILQERDSGDSVVGTSQQTYTATGEPQLLEHERAFGGTGVKARIRVNTASTPVETTFWADQFQLVQLPDVETDGYEIQWAIGDDAWTDLATVEGDGVVEERTGLAYDLFAPNGVEVDYRARAYHAFDDGSRSFSTWVYGVASWNSSGWWLKHPTRPSRNRSFMVRSQPAKTREFVQGVHRVLGREHPVVVADVQGGWTGEIVFRLDTDADRQALDRLLMDSLPLYLQGGADQHDWEDKWVVFGSLNRSRVIDNAAFPYSFDSLPWSEVDNPGLTLLAWPDV